MNILNRYTLKTLKENKSRTLVTILGIILSLSMFTAVTSLVASTQAFLVNLEIADGGNWHCASVNCGYDRLRRLEKDERVEKVIPMETVGFRYWPWDSLYSSISRVDRGFYSEMSVHITSGRAPENDSELLVPDFFAHLVSLGDKVNIETGDRIYEPTGDKLTVYDFQSYDMEHLEITDEKEYTVVGYYTNTNYAYFAGNISLIFTAGQPDGTLPVTAYIRTFNPSEAPDVAARYSPDGGAVTNRSLLRYMGVGGNNGNYARVLYGLGAVLMTIIAVASISLIYNAFSISVSERTKQFGLLSSIGATRKQLKNSVLFEAMVLCVAGIPLGVLSGLAGVYVTLKLTEDMLGGLVDYMFGSVGPVAFEMKISPEAIALAAAAGLVTVLISAYIPARKALKMSAIDAIRQSADIQISAKKVKTGPFVRRLLGFEGMMAVKNFRRSKKRYRATVISLFISIVLFVSVYSFSQYLSRSVLRFMSPVDYSLEYYYSPTEEATLTPRQLMDELEQLEGVQRRRMVYNYYTSSQIQRRNMYSEELYRRGEITDEGVVISSLLVFVGDENFARRLESQGIDPSPYLSDGRTMGVTDNRYMYFNTDDRKYYETTALKNLPATITSPTSDHGPFTVAATVETLPFGTTAQSNSLMFIFPESSLENIVGEPFNPTLLFDAPQHSRVEKAMALKLEQLGFSSYIYNIGQENEMLTAAVTMVNVFIYGFITLISLIAAANVFNTISTNIALRRREFAVMSSVGLTHRGLGKIMACECILYGAKALLPALPVSLAVSRIFRKVINIGYNVGYILPVGGMAASGLCVFVIVAASMAYGAAKLKKRDVVSSLRNENF